MDSISGDVTDLEREPAECLDDKLSLAKVWGLVNARKMSGQGANGAQELKRDQLGS